MDGVSSEDCEVVAVRRNDKLLDLACDGSLEDLFGVRVEWCLVWHEGTCSVVLVLGVLGRIL